MHERPVGDVEQYKCSPSTNTNGSGAMAVRAHHTAWPKPWGRGRRWGGKRERETENSKGDYEIIGGQGGQKLCGIASRKRLHFFPPQI